MKFKLTTQKVFQIFTDFEVDADGILENFPMKLTNDLGEIFKNPTFATKIAETQTPYGTNNIDNYHIVSIEEIHSYNNQNIQATESVDAQNSQIIKPTNENPTSTEPIPSNP